VGVKNQEERRDNGLEVLHRPKKGKRRKSSDTIGNGPGSIVNFSVQWIQENLPLK